MKLLTRLRRHGKNDDIPYAIGGIVGVLAFLVLGLFSLSIVDSYLLRNTSLAAVISAVLIDLTNGDRSASKLDGLTVSPALTSAAQAKANDMAEKGYFAHVSPDGQNSWYWFKQAGYPFLYAGENLAVDFSDSIDVERAWIHSPTHRANILNGHFTHIGIATARGTYQGRSTTFVVQMFGTPAELNAPVAAVQTIASPKEPTSPALAATPPITLVAASTAPPKLVLGAVADSILPPPARWWQHLLASPKSMLQYAYLTLASLILILFAFATEFEFHRRHMRHTVAAVSLFVLMAGLFTFANVVLFSHAVVVATAH